MGTEQVEFTVVLESQIETYAFCHRPKCLQQGFHANGRQQHHAFVHYEFGSDVFYFRSLRTRMCAVYGLSCYKFIGEKGGIVSQEPKVVEVW